MKGSGQTKKGTVHWDDLEEFEKSNDLLKEENFLTLLEMSMNLDYSTIPDDVNYNDDEWLEKKAAAKAAAKAKSEETER